MRVNFHAVTTLPATLEPNAFYYVSNNIVAESYLTDSAGVAKAVGNSIMINQLIADSLVEWEKTANSMPIVPTIAERDALILTLEKNTFILVLDASSDATVDAGSALYAFDFATQTTYKIAEYESMDLTIQWTAIQGRPSSTPAQIDDSVGKAHAHSNKAVLDKFTEASGELLYGGETIASHWATKDW